jgi:hypothetical protein
MRSFWRVVCRITVVFLLGFALYWSYRLSWGDFLARSADENSIRAAIRYAPGNSLYHKQLAATIEARGGNGADELRKAAELNPLDARVIIDLGLRAEMRGDFAAAERQLLQAASISRRYEPRWTLANFYFRRARPEFWTWARAALEFSYGDVRPVLALCWKVRPDPDFVLEQAIPDRPEVLRKYLQFLVGQKIIAGAFRTSERLLAVSTMEDRPVLLAYVNRLLGDGSHDMALDLWNRMIQKQLLRYAQVDVARDAHITNGRFLHPPVQAGFDWRSFEAPGVRIDFAPGSCRISFSGKQPESRELLVQQIPVRPRTLYVFIYDYNTREIPADSGLQWRVYDAATGADFSHSSPSLSSDAPASGRMPFTTGPDARFVRMVLAYHRPLGKTRIDGTAVLNQVALTRVR